MVSTGVESITIWVEALSCKCAASMQEELVAKGLASALLLHVLAPIKVVISIENIRAFKSLTAGFMEKSIGSKKRLVVSWTDLQIVQLLCRQMKYKSHRISPEP